MRGIFIHHPSGDPQKISISYDGVSTSTFNSNMWGVDWDVSITEGGSSGAPLFNQNYSLVGQLRGGASSCNNRAGNDRFGKLSSSWYGGGATNTQLKYWLSPNQDLQSIGKLNRARIIGPDVLCYGSQATYTMPNFPPNLSAAWAISGGLQAISTTNNSITVTPRSSTTGEIGFVRAIYNGVQVATDSMQVGLPAGNGVRMFNSTTSTWN